MSTRTTNLDLELPIGTEKVSRQIINENYQKIDEFAGDTNDAIAADGAAISALQDGIAIVANGNTHAAIASGQFVYVKNHSTLADGLYKATTAIGSNVALSTSNLTADASGGLNALKADVDTLNSNLSALSNKASYIYEGANFATLKDFILWVKTQAGNSNKIHYGRVENMTTDNPFGTSSFNFFFSFSSANYGWICCFADNKVGGLVHIAVNGSTAYLQKPTITTTNYSLE